MHLQIRTKAMHPGSLRGGVQGQLVKDGRVDTKDGSSKDGGLFFVEGHQREAVTKIGLLFPT